MHGCIKCHGPTDTGGHCPLCDAEPRHTPNPELTLCRMVLNASGTAHRLTEFLREAAKQIEKDASKGTPGPWFVKSNGGGFYGDWECKVRLDTPPIRNGGSYPCSICKTTHPPGFCCG